MKKLAVVFAVVVSGFVNAQWHDSKLDSLIVIPNFFREYKHLQSVDSIIMSNISDSLKYIEVQDLIDSRYGSILGENYDIVWSVVMTNGDISIAILKLDDYEHTMINTYLSNMEASYQAGILLKEVEESFFIMNNK